MLRRSRHSRSRLATQRSDDLVAAFIERYGIEVGREHRTGSRGLRDRLARHDGGGVDEFKAGRECYGVHDERHVEGQLFLRRSDD